MALELTIRCDRCKISGPTTVVDERKPSAAIKTLRSRPHFHRFRIVASGPMQDVCLKCGEKLLEERRRGS